MKKKYLFAILIVLIIICVLGFFILIYHPKDYIVLREVEEIGIEAYNMKFNKFDKQEVWIVSAMEVCESIVENNNIYENIIKFEYVPISGDIIERANEVPWDKYKTSDMIRNYTYYIEITGYTSEGVINAIRIEQMERGQSSKENSGDKV